MTRKLKPHELPGWPARMGLSLAAAYVDESPSLFAARVKAGHWPNGRRDEGRRVYWYRDELDRVLARSRRSMESMTPEDIDREIGLGEDDDRSAA